MPSSPIAQSASSTLEVPPTTGGRLVVAYRSEPQTFNRYVSASVHEQLIAQLTQATLVRVNRSTGAIEPRLATSWTASPDGLTWTMAGDLLLLDDSELE